MKFIVLKNDTPRTRKLTLRFGEVWEVLATAPGPHGEASFFYLIENRQQTYSRWVPKTMTRPATDAEVLSYVKE